MSLMFLVVFVPIKQHFTFVLTLNLLEKRLKEACFLVLFETYKINQLCLKQVWLPIVPTIVCPAPFLPILPFQFGGKELKIQEISTFLSYFLSINYGFWYPCFCLGTIFTFYSQQKPTSFKQNLIMNSALKTKLPTNVVLCPFEEEFA